MEISQGAPMTAAINVVGVARTRARISMSFRPMRSERMPQKGPVRRRVTPWTLVAMAIQNRAFASLRAPIWRR